MFFGLVFGVVAGLGLPFVAGPLADMTKSRFELNERDTGIMTFGAVLLIAALIGSILFSGFNAFWLVIGGLLGVFGMRLFTQAKAQTNDMMAARKAKAESAVEKVEDIVEDAADAVSDTVEELADKV